MVPAKRIINGLRLFIRSKFDEFLEPASNGSKRSLYFLFVAAGCFTLLAWVVAFLLLFADGSSIGGTFGDFVGGTLNPVLSFLTFMALLVTIVLQQTELADTRRELAASARALESQRNSLDRQNFEATFFRMLSLHNTIVNSIDLEWYTQKKSNLGASEFKERRKKGRDCFIMFYDDYRNYYENSSHLHEERDRLQGAYDKMWEKRQKDLAHYYRYLYNVFRFVYEYKGIDDKLKYIKLLRAQLSDYELLMLFYTALNKNGIKYWLYIHEYSLFDNLPPSLLIDVSHKGFYSPRSFGEPKDEVPTDWPPRALAAEYDADHQTPQGSVSPA